MPFLVLKAATFAWETCLREKDHESVEVSERTPEQEHLDHSRMPVVQSAASTKVDDGRILQGFTTVSHSIRAKAGTSLMTESRILPARMPLADARRSDG